MTPLLHSLYLLFPVTLKIFICMVVLFPLCITCISIVSVTCSFIRMRQTSYGGFWKIETKLARSVNFTLRYIADVLSLNNYRFGDFFDPIELDIKDTTNTVRSDSYLELHSGDKLRTKLCVNIFPMWTFHLCVSTFQQHLYMEYTCISLGWSDIPELVVPIMILLIICCC